MIVEEGFNGSGDVPNGSSSGDAPGSEHTPDSAGVEEVDASNMPSVPGRSGIRIPPGNDVPIVVVPTPRPTTLVGEVDVVSTREPASEAVPMPVPIGGVEEIICAYPWDCATAMRIVSCETGGTFNPHAVGDDGERGWFQIRHNHWDKPQCNPEYLFDPVYNTACAYSIWVDQGWWPWSCY